MTRRISGRTLPNRKSRIVKALRLAQKYLTIVYASTVLENPFNIAFSDLDQLKSIPGYVNVLEAINRYLTTGNKKNLENLKSIQRMNRFLYRMTAVPELDMYSEIEYNLDKAIKVLTSCINKIQMINIGQSDKDLIEQILKSIRSKLRKV